MLLKIKRRTGLVARSFPCPSVDSLKNPLILYNFLVILPFLVNLREAKISRIDIPKKKKNKEKRQNYLWYIYD